ncbi:MAG TPA: DUF4294 domain-containing protein [Chitinophagales bacterium]|nr:DUF4294 domain-containing protein [Chitinophagales bacterium]HNO48699.1 DUF4294 domain-containing protein [Chitinophagales bacterium]
MKQLISFLSFTLLCFCVKAQKMDTIILPSIVIGGDTLVEEVILEPIIVAASKLKPVTISYRDQTYLKKVYPYALRIARLSQVIDEQLKNMSKKERQKFLNNAENLLRDAYEKELKNMTRTQGKFLIKLVYRETGVTVFDLLKEYRGGFKTFWWNFGSKFFDLNLKATYDPKGTDAELENYVIRLDETYQRNGTKYIIQNEKFNLNIQSKKGKSKRDKSE